MVPIARETMHDRKKRQIGKRKAGSLEKLTAETIAQAANKRENDWKEAANQAGGVERLRTNHHPPKSYKKPFKPMLIRDKSPWEVIVERDAAKLVKLRRLSYAHGIVCCLPAYGFIFSPVKKEWVRYER